MYSILPGNECHNPHVFILLLVLSQDKYGVPPAADGAADATLAPYVKSSSVSQLIAKNEKSINGGGASGSGSAKSRSGSVGSVSSASLFSHSDKTKHGGLDLCRHPPPTSLAASGHRVQECVQQCRLALSVGGWAVCAHVLCEEGALCF